MNNKVQPIRASEIQSVKNASIPDKVIEAFNELIAKDFNGSSAKVRQGEVVRLIVKKGINQADLYSNNWLDVENLYRKNGWNVVYDKPGFNESYEASFEFRKKSRSSDED